MTTNADRYLSGGRGGVERGGDPERGFMYRGVPAKLQAHAGCPAMGCAAQSWRRLHSLLRTHDTADTIKRMNGSSFRPAEGHRVSSAMVPRANRSALH